MKNTWTIGRRISTAFACLGLVTALVGVIAYHDSTESQKSLHEVGETHLPTVRDFLTIAVAVRQIEAAQHTQLIPELGAEARAAQDQQIAAGLAAHQTARDDLARRTLARETGRAWAEFETLWDAWRADAEAYAALNERFGALAISNPPALERDLQLFIADHHRLNLMLFDHIETGAEFPGGDDDGACNFGRWLASFHSDNPDLARMLQAVRPHHEAYHAHVKRAKELASAGEKEAAVQILRVDMEAAKRATFAGFDELLAKSREATALREQMHRQLTEVCGASQSRVDAHLAHLVEQEEALADGVVASSVANARRLRTFTLATMVAALTLVAALSFWITRGINRTLKRVAGELNDGAAQVAAAAAAGQVSASSQSLAEGASEQAASLEETSSSMEELSSMTKRNAENARRAKDLTTQARQAADQGATNMEAMSRTMASMKTGADNITKIIKTIDEIAFQTNILALNAAVEAARAGEAGMGFAVVADEVRALARRSAEAAKETATMIQESVTWTTQGVTLSAQVAGSLSDILTRTTAVDELVAEVAGASDEQSQGLDQINAALGQLDKVVQTNASGAEECAASAEELNAQSQSMRANVNTLLQLVQGSASDASAAAIKQHA